MKLPAVLGIYREQIFSPGKIREDAAVIDTVLAALSAFGWSVEAIRGESLESSAQRPGMVLTMAQSPPVLDLLEQWTGQGTVVINSVRAIRNCYREPLTRTLSRAGVPVPAGRIFALGDGEEEISFESSALEGRLWLKRGDVHAIQEGDVVSVASPEALTEALGHFRANGIRQVLVQEHVDGDVVKFYGVGDRAFFRVFSASGEDVTDRMGSLQVLARRAARAVGLEVYGGDAVIGPHGEIRLIDLNDWPSFSRCCESAGASIATYLVDRKPSPAA